MKLSSIFRIFTVLAFAILFTVSLLPTGEAASITLSPSGGAHDEQLINDAIHKYDTIYLGEGTFCISGSIYTLDNIRIMGAGTDKTILQVTDPSLFFTKGAGIIYIHGMENVELAGFTLHGGETPETNRQNSGNGWGNAIVLDGGATKCAIHDIFFTRLDGDAIRATGHTSNNKVYNCIADTTGHDFVQLWNGNGWHIYNNLVNLNINTGVRFANSENCELDRNTFYCNTKSGFVATEIEDTVHNINIHHNVYRDLDNPYNCGIGTVHANGDIDIKNNIFYNCKPHELEGIKYTFENNAYELGEIPGAGYDPKYSTGIIPTIQRQIAPLTNSIQSDTETTQSIQGDPSEIKTPGDIKTTDEQEQVINLHAVLRFMQDLVDIFARAPATWLSEFATCLSIMAAAYILVYVVSRFLLRL